MAYKKEKTPQEWDKIRFQNSLGPQIGGLIHDAVALAVATKKVDPASIKHYLDMLYIIAENKKREITEIKPVDIKAQEEGEKWQRKHNKECKLDDIERANEEAGLIAETEEKNETYTTPSKEQFGEAQDK